MELLHHEEPLTSSLRHNHDIEVFPVLDDWSLTCGLVHAALSVTSVGL